MFIAPLLAARDRAHLGKKNNCQEMRIAADQAADDVRPDTQGNVIARADKRRRFPSSTTKALP